MEQTCKWSGEPCQMRSCQKKTSMYLCKMKFVQDETSNTLLPDKHRITTVCKCGEAFSVKYGIKSAVWRLV